MQLQLQESRPAIHRPCGERRPLCLRVKGKGSDELTVPCSYFTAKRLFGEGLPQFSVENAPMPLLYMKPLEHLRFPR